MNTLVPAADLAGLNQQQMAVVDFERVEPASRIALHALSLGFEHPATGKPFVFESPWPSTMRRFMGK